MTHHIAVFPAASDSGVVGKILAAGLTIRNPDTGRIAAFSSEGIEADIQTDSEAIDFLLAGNGISFWLAGNHDFFLSYNTSGTLSGSFDGFTINERESLLARLREVGLPVEVLPDD